MENPALAGQKKNSSLLLRLSLRPESVWTQRTWGPPPAETHRGNARFQNNNE